MLLRQIFDPDLAQYSYLVASQQAKEAVVVDPQRDIDRYLSLAAEEGVQIVAVVETHIHADFLSGAREMVEGTGVRAYLSAEGGDDWQYAWAAPEAADSGSARVVLLRDGDCFSVGGIEFRALATPGHTPEHLCFLVTDRAAGATTPVGVFSGDFVLVNDMGRPDLLELAGAAQASPESAARDLFASLDRFTELEDHLQVWPGHGAGSSCGKAIGAVPTSTVGYEMRHNRPLRRAAEGEAAFVRALLADQPTPPTYFGRMKKTNRAGPPLLQRLPRPRRLSLPEVEGIAGHGETVVIDTRLDRARFMEAHLPGALHAPLGRTFSTAVGSMLAEESRQIVLVVEESGLERAVRDLVRMGYDRVVAYLDEATLGKHLTAGGEAASIDTADFQELSALISSSPAVVVDVRDRFEFAEGHIPGAVNAPYTRLPSYLEKRIPADRPLVVHCEAGVRSAVASSFLAACGREVLYIDDDWSSWAESGGEVVQAQ